MASYVAAGLVKNELCIWASPPLREEDAKDLLRSSVPNFDAHVAAGQIEILQTYVYDPQCMTGAWKEKLIFALTKGYVGMRVSGNASSLEANLWEEFREYEQEVNLALAEQKMIAMCTYPLKDTRAIDLLNVARLQNFTIARRNGEWEFLEEHALEPDKLEIRRLGALNIESDGFPGSDLLTPRERTVLAQLVAGATSKEAGRALHVSPRTIDFHRADIMRRLGAKNMADLVRKILSE